MARIEIDESLFPILVQHMPAEIGNDDVEEMISFYEAFLARRSTRKHAVVIECAPDHRGLNPSQRKRVGEWNNDLIERYGHPGVITAIVIRSAIVRGALTAFNWISPPRAPQKTCATLLEAFDVCIEALTKAGVVIPPNVRAHRDGLARKRTTG